MPSSSQPDPSHSSTASKAADPGLPHERDESKDSAAGGTGARGIMQQAHDDIEAGQKDTDLHNQKGVEAAKEKGA